MAYKLQYTADGYPFYTEDDSGNNDAVSTGISPGPLPTDVSTLRDYAATLPAQQPNPLPTHNTYVQTAGEKAASILTGGMGQERYQFFPERIVRSALSLPTDVMQGKVQTPIVSPTVPISEDSQDELLQRVQDMAALMGGGGVAMAEKGAVGSAGGKLIQPQDLVNEAFHGTPKTGFNRFQVPDAANEYMPDRALGVHVTKDPVIANHFAEGTGSKRDTVENGAVYPVKIPDDSHFLEVDQPLLPYIKDRSTPKTANNVHSDQNQIEQLIYKTAFQKDPEMLARYLTEARAVPKEAATKLANDMVAGKSVTLPVDGPNYDLDRFVRNFNGKPYNAADRAKAVDLFKKEMQSQGYVGLKYINTSPMETAGAKDPTSYVIFDPSKHIKSKYTNTLMSDTSKPGTVLAALENRAPAPPFYSAVENAVNTASLKSAPAKQWLSTIANAKGVKPEELNWTGLKDYLGEQSGPVTKEQVQEYLQANKVGVQEVNKGQAGIHVEPNEEEPHILQVYRADDPTGEHSGMVGEIIKQPNGLFKLNVPELARAEFATQQEAENYIIRNTDFGAVTKYHKYQLPGGEPRSYREKLLTLPQRNRPGYKIVPNPEGNGFSIQRPNGAYIKSFGDKPASWATEHLARETGLPYAQREANEIASSFGPILKDINTVKDIQDARLYNSAFKETLKNYNDQQALDLVNEAKQVGEYQLPYKSSHWDEPNILAHIRQNDRVVVGENGQNDIRPSSHIEEIQSDWHQAGRSKGYKLSKEEQDKLEPEFNRIDNKIVNSGDEQVMGEPHIDTAVKMAVDRKIITQDEANTYLRYNDSTKIGAVPDAPFKKTWLDLALKRVIREAAEQGKDRISWTPGEAQAARYDLSKQIKSLAYKQNADGTYTLSGTLPNGSGHMFGENIKKEELPDYIGKEIAEKISNNEGKDVNFAANNEPTDIRKELRGLDLKIGGEGMHYFYDVMLPKALEKLTGEKMKVGNSSTGKGYTLENQHGIQSYGGANLEAAKKSLEMKLTNSNDKTWKIKDIDAQKVNYIDLPQSVKDTALHKGFPLFSSGMMLNPIQGNPPGLTPLNHDPFSRGEPHDDPEVNNKDDVPYLAGASNTPSGLPVNIDRRMPRYDPKLLKPDGQPADLWKYLKIHELEEYHNMRLGMSYPKAHKDKATPAERAAVEADGVNWKEYEHIMDGYLKEIEHEKGVHPPANLYTKPYAHDKSKLNG